jgi:hypothetical protein
MIPARASCPGVTRRQPSAPRGPVGADSRPRILAVGGVEDSEVQESHTPVCTRELRSPDGRNSDNDFRGCAECGSSGRLPNFAERLSSESTLARLDAQTKVNPLRAVSPGRNAVTSVSGPTPSVSRCELCLLRSFRTCAQAQVGSALRADTPTHFRTVSPSDSAKHPWGTQPSQGTRRPGAETGARVNGRGLATSESETSRGALGVRA